MPVIAILFYSVFLLCVNANYAAAQEFTYPMDTGTEEIFENITGKTDKSVRAVFADGGLSLLEALEYGLRNSSSILSSRINYDSAQLERQIAGGAFDPQASASINTSLNRSPFDRDTQEFLGIDASESISDSAYVSLSKAMRTGTVVGLSADVSRFESRTSSFTPTASSTLQVFIRQPLLRGFGDEAVRGPEMIADLSAEAARKSLIFDISNTANEIVQNFWAYADAAELLAIYRTSLQRLQALISEFDELRAQGKYPEADRNVITASAGSLDSLILQSEDFLRANRDNLGRSLGVRDDERSSIPPPVYTLYRAQEISKDNYNKFLEHARNNRADLGSRRLSEKMSEISVARAENEALPVLDISGSLGRSRISESANRGDVISSLYDGNSGDSWSAGMFLSYPIGNNAAMGRLRQQRLSGLTTRLGIYDLERSVSLSVAESYDRIDSLRKQIEQNEKTFANFLSLYREQLQGLRAGSASLFDLVQTEKDLTNAELTLAATLIQYYQQLSRFRFETSTLITSEDESSISFSDRSLLSADFIDRP